MSHDALGWLAALATLACFASSEMLRLRILALVANVAFVAYATQSGLLPVLVLHLVLAPVNAWRLWQLVRVRLIERPSSPQATSLPAGPATRRGSS
jgi:hypothetical protein